MSPDQCTPPRGASFPLRIGCLIFLAACGDNAPEHSINGVSPAEGLVGRTVHVELSGDQTRWNATTKVDFGPGTTIAAIAAASPTVLVVDVTIADTAALGPRDITVTTDDELLTLGGAFSLVPPIGIAFATPPLQGSIAPYTIFNRDPATPFDTTYALRPDGSRRFTNVAITSAGMSFTVDTVDGDMITGQAFCDVDAAANHVVVASGATAPVLSAIDVAVKPRAAQPVASAGIAVTDVLALPYESRLYVISPPGFPLLLRFLVHADRARVTLLGGSGHFADRLADRRVAANAIVTSGVTYAIVEDPTGLADSSFELDLRTTPLGPAVAEDDIPNNVSAGAQPLTAPAFVDNATLRSQLDEDWFVITATAGDLGKHLVVVTAPGSERADTVVHLWQGVSLVDFGGASDDTDFHENWTSPTIAATGPYYIQIFASASGFFDVAQNAYRAAVLIED